MSKQRNKGSLYANKQKNTPPVKSTTKAWGLDTRISFLLLIVTVISVVILWLNYDISRKDLTSDLSISFIKQDQYQIGNGPNPMQMDAYGEGQGIVVVEKNNALCPLKMLVSNNGGADIAITQFKVNIRTGSDEKVITMESYTNRAIVLDPSTLPTNVNSISSYLLKDNAWMAIQPKSDNLISMPLNIQARASMTMNLGVLLNMKEELFDMDNIKKQGPPPHVIDQQKVIVDFMRVTSPLLPFKVSFEFTTSENKIISTEVSNCFEGIFLFPYPLPADDIVTEVP